MNAMPSVSRLEATTPILIHVLPSGLLKQHVETTLGPVPLLCISTIVRSLRHRLLLFKATQRDITL